MPETAPTEPSPAAELPSETEPDAVSVELEEMTLDEKLCQMFVVTPEALTGDAPVTDCGDALIQALQTYPVGGLIFFSDNLVTVPQTQAMLSGVQEAVPDAPGLLLCVDEEGGSVARAAKTLGTAAVSPMAEYGKRGDRAEAVTVGETLGTSLHTLGFNVDFAPVADVDLCSGNELGDRIFSSDPDVTARMVAGVTEGLTNCGVAATLKHFPGLGAENGNAHTDAKITIDRTLAQLRETEFVPFRSGIDAGAAFVMVSHQTVTGVGDDLPASVSPTVCTTLLREELAFSGIIITDSFQMETICGRYDAGEAAVLSVEAGADIVLMPEDLDAALTGMREAVRSGRLTEERIDESVMRILEEKETLGLLR